MATDEERYLAKVDRSGGPDACWPWTGSTNQKGYGLFWDGTRHNGHPHIVSASRWGYRRYVGPIRGKLQVLHRCDNPPCQNPRCWFLGTNRDNVDDRVAKGRSRRVGNPEATRARGAGHGHSRFTEDDIRAIRAAWADGVKNTMLAERYRTSSGTISMIVNRKRWAHIA